MNSSSSPLLLLEATLRKCNNPKENNGILPTRVKQQLHWMQNFSPFTRATTETGQYNFKCLRMGWLTLKACSDQKWWWYFHIKSLKNIWFSIWSVAGPNYLQKLQIASKLFFGFLSLDWGTFLFGFIYFSTHKITLFKR